MTLCDTGPMVALADQSEQAHARCLAALESLPRLPAITTWPCLTEAMHLLGRKGELAAQEELWTWFVDGWFALHQPQEREWERVRTLMRQYGDAPMDLADASLVAAAESLNVRQIITLDRHFHAYRIHGRFPFEVLP